MYSHFIKRYVKKQIICGLNDGELIEKCIVPYCNQDVLQYGEKAC